MHKRSSSHGFTMLEVLISIVVIAFGLLGVAGLQAFAVKNNQSAGLRITATTVAMDMVDRVHANWRAMAVEAPAVPAYNQPSTSSYNTLVANCNASAGCSSAEMAQNDLAEWRTLVGTVLPNGQGIVCLDSTPNDGATAAAPACDNVGVDNYVVKIWWRDDRSGTAVGAAMQRLVWPFRP